jgi:hypothetical protein
MSADGWREVFLESNVGFLDYPVMDADHRAGDALYFAYGSNMLSGRLRKRGVDTVKLRNATLAGHSLRFHK